MLTPDIIEQMLTSRLLKELPLVFTAGMLVCHPTLGICKVLAAQGPRRRLVSYRRIEYRPGEDPDGQVWLDVGVLEEFELIMRRDVQALSADDLDQSLGLGLGLGDSGEQDDDDLKDQRKGDKQ